MQKLHSFFFCWTPLYFFSACLSLISHFLSYCFNHQTFSSPFFKYISLPFHLFSISLHMFPYLTHFVFFVCLFSSDIFFYIFSSNSYIISFNSLSLSLAHYFIFSLPRHYFASYPSLYYLCHFSFSFFLSFFLFSFFLGRNPLFLLWCYRIKPQIICLSLSAHEESNFFLTFNLLNRHIWLISHSTIHPSYLASQLHEASKDFEFWWRLRSPLIAFLLITSSSSFTSNLRPFSWKCNSLAQPCRLLQNKNPHPHLQPRVFEFSKP